MAGWKRLLPWTAWAVVTLAVVLAVLSVRDAFSVRATWKGDALVVVSPVDFPYEVTHVYVLSSRGGPSARAWARLPRPGLSINGESVSFDRKLLQSLAWVSTSGGGSAVPPGPGERVGVLWRRLERADAR